MRKALFIFLLFSVFVAQAQDIDTTQTITISVKRVHTPLSCIYSRSNTIYTNVTNIVRVNYADTGRVQYELQTDLGFIKKMGHNFFMVVKHNAGSLVVNIWRDSSNGTKQMVGAQEFAVQTIPRASIIVGGYVIDSTAYVSDLLNYRHLNLAFGDFTPMNETCNVHSFDMKIDGVTYHSASDTLTDDMITAIKYTKETMLLKNVMATLNSADDVDQTLSADKKRRVLTQRVYNVENESKPIVLLR